MPQPTTASERSRQPKEIRTLVGQVTRYLGEAGVKPENLPVWRVPGANEIPVAVKGMLDGGSFHAVVALGVIVRGDTLHYEVLAYSTADALLRVSTDTGTPVINGIVVDLIERSSALLRDANPADIDAVRLHGGPLIQMSDEVWSEHLELKRFLRERLYRHYRVQRMTRKARTVVTDLYRAFMEDPMLLPDEHRAVGHVLDGDTQVVVVEALDDQFR